MLVDLALHNSVASKTGKRIGVETGDRAPKYGNDGDLADEMVRDTAKYTASVIMSEKHIFGGVTASGGEPLRQSSFVVALFRHSREAGFSTVLETSGFSSAAVLRDVLRFTDLVLFDLKQLEGPEHRRLTSRPIEPIVRNARLVATSEARVQFRIPLVPGLNSGLENIKATAAFLREVLRDEASIEFMPYHRLGVGKYQALDKAYPLEGLQSLDPTQVESVRQAFEEEGVRCLVSR